MIYNVGSIQEAVNTPFDNAGTNLASDNVQGALTEVNDKFNDLSFAQDPVTGKWGYRIGGADPVIPFKTAIEDSVTLKTLATGKGVYNNTIEKEFEEYSNLLFVCNSYTWQDTQAAQSTLTYDKAVLINTYTYGNYTSNQGSYVSNVYLVSGHKENDAYRLNTNFAGRVVILGLKS